MTCLSLPMALYLPFWGHHSLERSQNPSFLLSWLCVVCVGVLSHSICVSDIPHDLWLLVMAGRDLPSWDTLRTQHPSTVTTRVYHHPDQARDKTGAPAVWDRGWICLIAMIGQYGLLEFSNVLIILKNQVWQFLTFDMFEIPCIANLVHRSEISLNCHHQPLYQMHFSLTCCGIWDTI